LLDRPHTANLYDVVRALSFGNTLYLSTPVRICLIVDGIVRTEFGFHVLELLVAGRCDDGYGTSDFSKDESRQRNSPSPYRL